MNYTKYTFLQYLFDNISEYKEYWLVNDFERWKRAPELRTFGIAAHTLLSFTIDEIEKGSNKYLKLIFNLIEDMLNSDNEDAQYAAYMMFLDSLFNTSSHSDTTVPYNLWVHLLGSKSKEAIKEIEQF